MQDLTTGPITRHLLKTTGFMLVTMLFQTLYFLIDLYWVGRLGTAAVAAVGIAGNLTFIVLALTQMLGVGTTAVISHAVGRKDAPQAVMLFNQAQVLAMLTGVLFLVIGLATRLPYARGMAADARTAELDAVPRLVRPRHGAAVRPGGDERGPARHRQLQDRHGGGNRDGHPQHDPRAVPHLRLGHRPSARRRRRGRCLTRRYRGGARMAHGILPQGRLLSAIRPERLAAATRRLA